MASRSNKDNQLKSFLDVTRSSLDAALCMCNFDSQLVERHNKPEIEQGTDPECILNPITITRKANQQVFIEPAINSCRISIKIEQANETEKLLVSHFTRFMVRRAEAFEILRRNPVKGYDISFLITNVHLEKLVKDKLIDFIIDFLRDVDSEVKDLRLKINARAKQCAANFLTSF